MSILVFNCGSSSIKASLFKEDPLTRLLNITIKNIGGSDGKLLVDDQLTSIKIKDHFQAFDAIFKVISESTHHLSSITCVGHRVIHGGEKFSDPIVITDNIEKIIDSLSWLAPLHNPNCLIGIREARKIYIKASHFAVFDTAFHSTLPSRAKIYALPEKLTSDLKIRRFGFHGISHDFVSKISAGYLCSQRHELKIISCHLGNGCSVTAIENGRSIETSMGMTPLEGLVMGSRSGDLDPGIIIQVLRDQRLSSAQLDCLLNQQSGLLGMTGTSNMFEIELRAANGDESCRSAIQVFSHRVRKYIGAYAAVMGGVDVILFTGGIGENSNLIRQRIAQRFDYLGATLDDDRNRDAKVNWMAPIAEISATTSRVKILLVATDEEKAIATSIIEQQHIHKQLYGSPHIPVAVSARHAHLTTDTIEKLFGSGYKLTIDHPLSQPGQFACKETITIVGPRNHIENVKILGPTRSHNQIEISRSDEFYLGVDAPVRPSGDTDNSPGITVIGPAGAVNLRKGLICALRHIHMHPDDALKFNVKQGDLVDVRVNGENRSLTFSNVKIRIDEKFCLEMHIDTDEANAAELKHHDTGILTRLNNHVLVVKRKPCL